MPKLSIDLLKQEQIYLIVSCLILPISLEISLLCFACFLILRILWFDLWELGEQSDKLTQSLKIALSLAIAIAMGQFYGESRSHFYPVSYYDYLFIFIVTFIVKIYPFKEKDIQQLCSAIAVSPLIVFLVYLPTLDFSSRNHWGFGNPNWLGFYCSICLPLICCQILGCRQNKNSKVATQKSNQRLLTTAILSLLACTIMLVSSGSRSCLYVSAAIIGLILYLKIKTKKPGASQAKYLGDRPKKSKIILFRVTCFLIFGLLYKFLLAKFIFLPRFIDLDNSTNVYRVKIYQCYLQYGLEKPWWGWGFNQTAALCEEKLKAKYAGVNHAHNFILQLFADGGLIITLLCLIALIYFIIIPSLIFIFNNSFSARDLLYLGINLSSLSMVIISLFQSALYHYPLFPLWLGLLWGIQLSHRDRVVN